MLQGQSPKRTRGANADERVHVAEHHPRTPAAKKKKRRMEPQPTNKRQLLELSDHTLRRTRRRTGSPQIQERVVRVNGLTVTQAQLLRVPVTRTKQDYYTAKHLMYDIRNGHIEVEEEVNEEVNTAAAHDRARKAAHDV